MFLGYKVNSKGLKVCPDKVDDVLSLPSQKCLKDVQKLNGKLASLNRFLAKSAEKSLPFFKTLKKCTKKSDFHWKTEAEEAFKQMKQLIAELHMLTAPMEKEELIVYLAGAKETVSAVLMMEREAKQMPIYFVSRELRGPELNYTSMEKLVLALILSRPEVVGRLQKWSIELGEYATHYRPRVSVKGQKLADFIVERPEEDSPNTLMEEKEELPDLWILFTDGSSCTDGSRAGLILTNPEGIEFTYTLRFRFDATNNKAEYEALTAGQRIAEQMGVKNLKCGFTLSGQSSERSVCCKVGRHDPLSGKSKSTYRFGLPGEIILDNGKQFRDDPFKDWCEKLCSNQHFASVKHLQTNGLVERENRSLGEGIKQVGARSRWMEELPHVLLAHRTLIKFSNEDIPFSLTYGTEAVIPAEIGMPTIRTTEVDQVQNNEALQINLDLLEERREEAAIRDAKSKAKMEKYYNAKVRNTSFKPGDLVYHNNDASRAEDTGNRPQVGRTIRGNKSTWEMEHIS
ncbi:reverse transcriptase domain-containing protein [Tanacetum coccineum]|uniref:Reverse transcriptase domain-containing protein n=1 Tax=Tanacetum coccineum TaxID=301880 RepID=A0ABQ5I8I6_9ASTR